MTQAYQPFLISELKTGISTYLSPWVRPQDAFEPLENAYVYRGVLTKRNGSTIFGDQLADHQPVMGIMQYLDESTGATKLVVATTQFLYLYAPGATPDGGTFTKILTVSNSPFWSGTATGTITPNALFKNIAHASPGTVTITATYRPGGPDTIVDDGAGNFNASGILAAGSTINYVTGALSINFTGTTQNVTLTINLTLVNNPSFTLFTGTIKDFFNWTNWQPTSSVTALTTSYLYMTNNVDPVTLFDGTNLSRPAFYVNSISTKRIEKALDVKVYGNRLLLLRPFITGETNSANQDIYYSAIFNPFDFVGDIAGHGGVISAATGDTIMSARFLRDNLIIAFTNSTWTFQITGLRDPPFIFRKLSVSKNCSCPYAGISYDERVTNLGNTGFVACDGVNVQRYDIPIIDYYESKISQRYFNQDFSTRYDNLNQSWMFYPSQSDLFPIVGNIAPGSDQTLIYNFLENTWATYKNSFPMTCMGLFYVTSGTTWAELNVNPNNTWAETQFPWFSYGTQATAPLLLGGDTTGNIYHLDNPSAVRDGQSTVPGSGTSFNVNVTTTRWNPFMALGQKNQFGYIDIYYSVSSVDPSNPVVLELSFYVDNSNQVALTRQLTLDGPTTSITEVAAIGNGGNAYSGILSDGYVVPFSLEIVVPTSGGLESFDDNGSGILVGSLGHSGTINYNTSAWALNTTGFTVSVGAELVATYQFSDPSAFAFKRIYVNLIGEFIQMNIDPSEDAPFQILGFILWARPAGRLTHP